MRKTIAGKIRLNKASISARGQNNNSGGQIKIEAKEIVIEDSELDVSGEFKPITITLMRDDESETNE